jgi:hypothetical protein
MHRRRPGRRAHGACLPVLSTLAAALLAAGCGSSSGGRAPSSSATPGSRTSSATASSPEPIGLPVQASPTPVERAITRPPGAKIVDFATCIAPATVVPDALRSQIFNSSDRAEQQSQLSQLPQLVGPQLHDVRKARTTWLADGYPAGFPVVRDLDGFIAVYEQFLKVARTGNLDAVPGLYLRLVKVNAQYGADAGNSVCQH